MYQDNLVAISCTGEVQGLRNVKHVGMRYHKVKEPVENEHVVVWYILSKWNKAESLAKVLGGSFFKTHRRHLHVKDASSRRGVFEE